MTAGYPRPLAQCWPELPTNIGAALTWRKHSGNTTYFFAGDQYWKYDKVTVTQNLLQFYILLC